MLNGVIEFKGTDMNGNEVVEHLNLGITLDEFFGCKVSVVVVELVP